MAINRHIQISIAPGSPVSEGFQLDTGNLVGFLMPDSFSGNKMSFEIMRPSDGAYLPHFDSLGQEIEVIAGPSRSIALDGIIPGLPTRGFMRVRTNTPQTQPTSLLGVITEED
jgi:hypothetical protein